MTQPSPPLPSPPDHPEFLLASEVASLLRVGLATVYQWCATGKISHLKVNGVIRFQRHRIEQWLLEQASADSRPEPVTRPSPCKPAFLSRDALRMAGQRVARRTRQPSPLAPSLRLEGTSQQQT